MIRKIEHRAKIMYLPQNFLLEFLKGDLWVKACIPQEYHIADIHFDFSRKAFALVVESSVFPMVPEGEVIPSIELEMESIHLKKLDELVQLLREIKFERL